jgi:hypothetical protein
MSLDIAAENYGEDARAGFQKGRDESVQPALGTPM